MPNVSLNKNTGNIEVRYQRAPAEETRAALHGAGFKWHEPTATWWGSATNDRLALAVKIDPDFRPRKHARGKSLKASAAPAKANGSKAAAPAGLPAFSEWHRSSGGTGAAEGKHGYSVHLAGLGLAPVGDNRMVQVSPISSDRGRHLGYAVTSFALKHNAWEIITPAGLIISHNGVRAEHLFRSPQAGVAAARAAWASLQAGRGAKPNGNLGEALTDMRRKVAKAIAPSGRRGSERAKPAARSTAKRGAKSYRVSGDAREFDHAGAMKAARKIADAANRGAGAAGYNGGKLYVYNVTTKKKSAEWAADAAGQFARVSRR